MKRDPNCTLCKLHKEAEYVCLLGQGPVPCKVMIVGEAPGKREDASGKPFVGRSGHLLERVLGDYGFTRSNVFITNAVSCRPPDNRTPTKAEIRSCSAWLQYQIKKVRPTYVLLLGNVPLQSITGEGGIKKRRGKPFEVDGITYLPTYHPSYCLRFPEQEDILRADVKTFRSIVDNKGVPREEKLNPIYVDTREKFADLLASIRDSKFVSFDLETSCLYPWAPEAKIILLGLGTKHGEYSIPMQGVWSQHEADLMLETISMYLYDSSTEIVTSNGKFDFLWLWVHYGYEWHKHWHWDSQYAHYLLNENDRRGLKYLAQKYLGAPEWDIDKEDMATIPLDKLSHYHAHDLYYTRQLYPFLKKMMIEDEEITRVMHKLMMPTARLFVEVEYDGVCIDYEKMQEVEQYLIDRRAAAEKRLEKWGKINWGSPQQVAKLLFTDLKIKVAEKTKKGAPSTSESALNQIDHPCVQDLIEFRGAKQQLSFFIEGWKPFLVKRRIRGKDHYFLHPNFKLDGTVTGRPSCEHPNLQQVPRDERIRSLIIPPDGWEQVEVDLSQIELRIAAEIADVQQMKEAFAKKIDVHWLTAMREIERGAAMKDLVIKTARVLSGNKASVIRYGRAIEILLDKGPDAAADVDKEWKELRKKAKPVNFGYLYGMWWKKFRRYARDNYGVDITDEQAQSSREAYFDMYPELEDYHKRQKRYARQAGFVRTFTGRKRRLPDAQLKYQCFQRDEAERQAINSPVQGFAAELLLMSAIQLRKEFSRDIVRIIGTIHDACIFWVKRKYLEKATNRMLEIMQWPELLDEFEIKFEVPICGEAKVGPWGKNVTLEKALSSGTK